MVLGLISCGNPTFDEKMQSLYEGTVPLINADTLSRMRERNSNLVLLDARSKREFEVSHLPDAIWLDDENYKEFDYSHFGKDELMVVYCSVGVRSERVGEWLQEMGFQKVYNLYGGIFDWKNQDRVVVNNAGMPTDSVHTYSRRWSKWLNKGIKVYE